jgi:hypothetical protein
VLPLRHFSYLANDDDKPLETATLTKKKNPLELALFLLLLLLSYLGYSPTEPCERLRPWLGL